MKQFITLIILCSAFHSAQAFAGGAILNKVEHIESGSHFKVKYTFSNPIEAKHIKLDYINSTVQVDIVGAEIDQDKRFERIDDPMVKNLYSFKPDRDTLSLRINYESKVVAKKFDGRVKFEVQGSDLVVSVADGRAIAMGTLDKILEKPSNLNTQAVEDKYKYLQMKLSAEEEEVREKIPAPSVPKVVSAENFETDLAGKLKFDVSDSIKDEIPVARQPAAKKESPIQIRKVRGKDKSNENILIEEDISLKDGSSANDKLKEDEIPLFTKDEKKAEVEKASSFGGLMGGIVVLCGILGVSILALRRYSSKQIKKQKHHTIKILTQHHLGPKKSLAIIRVAGESILIGVTDSNINLIKSLSLMDEDLNEMENQNFDKKLNKAQQEEELGMGLDFVEEEEEFSVRGLKDMLSNKLSGMKEL